MKKEAALQLRRQANAAKQAPHEVQSQCVSLRHDLSHSNKTHAKLRQGLLAAPWSLLDALESDPQLWVSSWVPGDSERDGVNEVMRKGVVDVECDLLVVSFTGLLQLDPRCITNSSVIIIAVDLLHVQHELLRGWVPPQMAHHAHTMLAVAGDLLAHHYVHRGEADTKTVDKRPCFSALVANTRLCVDALLANHEKEGSAAKKKRDDECGLSAGQQEDGDKEGGAECSHLGAENNVDGVGGPA